MDERNLILLLAGLSFVPPLLYMVWVRNGERHQREPLAPLLGLFIYGGTLGVALALFLNLLSAGESIVWTAVIVAPFVEELSKGLGLGFVRGRIRELEDGIVYGAALGLGFAATENFLYGLSSYGDDGATGAITVVVARVFSSMLLHAGSSALLGFGYSQAILRRGSSWQVLPYYLVAVALHGLYNFLVLGQTWIGFAAGIAMVATVAVLLRQRLKALDAWASPGHP